MNNETVYWVWVQQTIGFASESILHIINSYTFVEDFYRAPLQQKMTCNCFSQKDLFKMSDTSLDGALSIVEKCKSCGIEIITIDSPLYPESLRNISAPPVVLYVKGNAEVLSGNLLLAIVGTRKATPYGQNIATSLSRQLAANGATIVSGGALGIDSFAHKGALQVDGKTVCVLGCGLEAKYLSQNDSMKKQILRKGVIVSEYPPDVRPSRITFPQRNRIISGLSRGVVVVEAGERSGSIITARLAMEQNRDVFAVPGNISSSLSFGTNCLIRDGAVSVTGVEDILRCYEDIEKMPVKYENNSRTISYNEQLTLDFEIEDTNFHQGLTNNKNLKKSNKAARNKSDKDTAENAEKEKKKLRVLSDSEKEDLSDNVIKVINSFGGEEQHIDTLVEKTGLPIGKLHSAVTQLELLGYVEALQGRKYKILVEI